MRRRRWMGVIVCLVLVLWLAAWPVLADDGGRTALFGQDYTLEPGERLDHDLLVFGGRVHLKRDSLVEGDVLITGGQAILEGRIKGDVLVLGGSAELAATAVIEKDLVVLGQLRRDQGATVKGNIVEGWEASGALSSVPGILGRQRWPQARPAPLPTRPWRRLGWSWGGLWADLVGLLALLLGAALLLALLPDNLRRITRALEEQMAFCVGVGLLTIAVVAVGSVILAVTCIGIPLALALGLALLLAALVGWVAAGQFVGRRVLQALQAKSQPPLVEIVLGVALISIAGKVPCIGWLFGLLALSWGLGAVVLTRLGTQPYPPLAPFEDRPPVPSTPPPSAAGVPPAPTGSARRGDTRPLDERTLDWHGPPEE